MTTVQSGTSSIISRPLKVIAVAALLLGTTAMFQPTPVQAAGFGGIFSHVMGIYGAHHGGGRHSGRSSRHSRHESSRHASRHHRGEHRSREARNEKPAPAARPAVKERRASADDGMDLTPSR